MIRRTAFALLGLGLAFGLAPGGAGAHGRSHSYSSWEIEEAGAGLGARVRARVPLLELTRLAGGLPDAGADPGGLYFARHLELLAGNQPCAPVGVPRRLPASEGWAAWSWQIRCPTAGPFAIRSDLFAEVAASHLHFARLALHDGRVVERVLSEAEPRWDIPQASEPGGDAHAAGTTLSGYVALGIEHILSGWDHLAFVAALLLLAATFGELAGLVTGFTVAHSVTLAVATLGWARPEPAAVEALIGFSIALVAAENAWLLAGRDRVLPWLVGAGLLGLTAAAAAGMGTVPAVTLGGVTLFTVCHFALLQRSSRPARLRAAVAFAFGLVHGFGFAGVLSELELPRNRLAPALFGFNVGVELGQLAVVALLWPALRGLEKLGDGRLHRTLAEVASAAICGLGLFWFVTRTFGA